MALVIVLLVYECLLVAGYLRYRWRRAQAGAPPPPKRMAHQTLVQLGIHQLALAGLLIFMFIGHAWTFESVGIRGDAHWLEAALAGELGYLLVMLVHVAILWMSGIRGRMNLVAVRGNMQVWPRGRASKWFARLFIMVFNPFTEELVMRGILIHQWGLLLGSPVIPIAVGLLLNGALHWYQGWRMQLWHALFFSMAVSLLYSPWGLIAAITAHVFGDFVPILTMRHQLMRAYAARHAARARTA